MAYQTGDRVGDYQIVDVLGAGGMGKVYKVRNIISERVEALKVLLPNLESDPELADRFMREIKVQARLQHTNIAGLHTALRVDNQLLMLIEYVEGVTLEAELRKGRIPVAKGVDYIQQALLALAYSHANGVVHRDIKPANMMLTPQGAIKLMDFGIAKMTADRRLTQTGRTVGSLYYMSPEQIQGALDLDGRSDLYSVGVSLYELATNRRPFQGDSDYSIMAAHLNANPVPPVEIDPSLPSILNEIILMAIAKDPDKRFQTADAFRTALASVSGAAVAVPGLAPTTAPVIAHVSVPPSIPSPPLNSSRSSGRRGLYMAIGSAATLGILALAAIQGPKWFSGSEASVSNSTPSLSQREAPAVPNATAPSGTPPVTTSTDATQTNSSPPVAERVVERPEETLNKPLANKEAPQMAQAVSQPAATASPIVVPPSPQTQVPPAAVTSTDTAALQELREEMMLLGTRVSGVKSSLITLKEQQARMGTNLRGDIVTAEQRLEFHLDEAETALKALDAKHSKRSLTSAERELERLEKFLGR